MAIVQITDKEKGQIWRTVNICQTHEGSFFIGFCSCSVWPLRLAGNQPMSQRTLQHSRESGLSTHAVAAAFIKNEVNQYRLNKVSNSSDG